MKRRQVRELAERVTALLASQDGFTLTATGRPLQSGYVVGGLVRREGDALAKLPQPHTPAEYEALELQTAALIAQHAQLIEQGAALGGWRQGESVSLDLVTTHTDRQAAALAARDRAQLAFGRLEAYRYAEEITI